MLLSVRIHACISNKEASFMDQTKQNQTTPPSPIVPLPRTGISGASGWLLYLLIGLSSLIFSLGISLLVGGSSIPTVISEGISLLYLIILVLYFLRTAKLVQKASRGITPLIVAGALFSFTFLGTLVPAAILFAPVFVIGEGAVLMATAKRRTLLLLPLIPIVTFLLALVLCGRADAAALTLLPFPAAVVLAIGTRSSAKSETGLTRVGVICATSLALALTAAAFAVWFYYRAVGTLEVSVLLEKLTAFREELTLALVQTEIAYGDTVVTPLAGKEAEVANIVNGMVNTLPGTLVAAVNIIVAVAQMLTLSGLHAYGFGASVTDRVRAFRISPVSSAMFLLSWIVALVAVGDNSSSTVVGTVAENLYTILIPGVALAGLLRLTQSLAKRGVRTGCGFFLLLFVPCLLFYAPTLLAAYEAVSSLLGPLVAKVKAPKEQPPHERRGKDRPLSDEELFDRYCQEQEERRKHSDDDNDRHDHDA